VRGITPLSALLAVAVLLLAAAGARASAPSARVVLPPGEGDTVTLGDYLANQAQGGCGGLGPHTCDQRGLYSRWGFRNGALASAPSEVSNAVSQEQPEAGLTIVRDAAGVPHVFAGGANGFLKMGQNVELTGYTNQALNTIASACGVRKADGNLVDNFGDPDTKNNGVIQPLIA